MARKHQMMLSGQNLRTNNRRIRNYEHRTSNRHYPQGAEDDTEGLFTKGGFLVWNT